MRHVWAVTGILLACAVSVRGDMQVAADRIVADTEKGRVVIERGMVVEMANRLTGETYTLAPAGAKLTGLLWHNSPVWVEPATKATSAPPKPNEATISFALAEGTEMRMTVAVDPATQDVLIRQSGAGERKGLQAVQWGIANLDARNLRTLVPGNSGVCLTQRCPQQDMRFQWPVGWEAQIAIVEGPRGGFSVRSEDAEMRFKGMRWQRDRDRVSLSFESQNYAPVDDLTAVESVEWRIAFFEGDWRTPAKRYRDWMEKTWGLARLASQRPAWVKDIRFLVICGMERDVLDALKARVPPSATLLYIPGWRKDPYDKNYPDYTADEKFGEFVRYAKGLGYHVMPHMNYFGCDPKHPAYEQFRQWHMRDPFTKDLLWWTWPHSWALKPGEEPTIRFAYIHPGSKAWRDDLTRRLVAAQREYGFDAIHLDQTLCICNAAAGKVDGLYVPQGNVLLHKQLREAMPDVALSGEGLDEVTCRYEAFAQRHASGAVDHSRGTWNDEFIECDHAISSYFFTPYTRIYGYLGMTNPDNQGLYLAWKRAYENWGVIPTYPRPTKAQIESGSAMVNTLFKEARLWVEDALEPDFEGAWTPQTKFRYVGRTGQAVTCDRDGFGGSRMNRTAGGASRLVYGTVRGRGRLEGPGSIAGWCAYNEKGIFGLDPDSTYLYVDDPRDLRAVHLSQAPDDALIRVLMHDDAKFMVECVGRPEEGAYDFVTHVDEAETGIVVDGKRGEMDHGAAFSSTNATCGGAVKRCIFAHPPWKVKATGPEPARTLGRFSVDLPKNDRAFLELAVGLRDGVNGRSDGARFLVEVEGEPVFDEVWAKSEWREARISLEKWCGKRVGIVFITTPGPADEVSFDWACWGEPRVRMETPPRRVGIRLASPKEVVLALGTDPDLKWRTAQGNDGMYSCDVDMTMPGRTVFLWEKAKPASPPLDLAATPFSVSVAVEGAPAQGPIQHVGAAAAEAKSNGIEKRGINAHPPNGGRTSVDYLLQLPDKKPLALSFAVGLRDGSLSTGVIFLVEANGQELYRQRVTRPDGWHPGEVDLSQFAGKELLLSLIVDSDGPYNYDWATWAEPMLR